MNKTCIEPGPTENQTMNPNLLPPAPTPARPPSKMWLRPLLALALVGLLAGPTACTTTYQASGKTGGYQDERLSANSFRVSFARNLYTKREATHAYLLHRCAELTKANGDDYFVIANFEDFELRRKYADSLGLDTIITTHKGAVPPNTPGAFEAQTVLDRNAPADKANRKINW